ncbi:MAG: DUF3524 domain-containing protein [Planctomycetota bacterium]|nr:DUF3524 domain-containing protein [Planctomycetota bacterium]
MDRPLHVLAVEPWLGGSHQRFLEGWQARSRHKIELLGLPARHWRWRMEGAALTLAERAAQTALPDVLVVSDYLDLARFRGFLPAAWRDVPALAYFHENQLAYPQRLDAVERHQDRALGFQNVLTLIAAEASAFNSRYHLETFAAAATELVRILPKPRPAGALEAALTRASVIYPGVDLEAYPLMAGPAEGAPLRIGWCHRWEYDKDPARFLHAILEVRARGANFELVLLGEAYEMMDEDVLRLLSRASSLVAHRGYAEDRAAHAQLLGSCDLVVSTARHEFYGMAMLEAAATGCRVLAPTELAYPETLTGALAEGLLEDHAQLVERLLQLATDPSRSRELRRSCRESVAAHDLALTATAMDERCDSLDAAR